MAKSVLVLLSLLLFWNISAAQAGTAEDNGWIIGKWELSRDPDGGRTDWMEFERDGKAASITSDGRRIPGEYTVKAAEVSIVYSYLGHSIPVVLTFTPDRKKLLLYSDRTRNTSEYQKLK